MELLGDKRPAPTLKMDFVSGEEGRASFARLLGQAFGVAEPASFLDDFPIWDERVGPRSDRLIRIGVWDGDELVSCAGARLGELHAPAGPLPVALIGAVATAGSHRGRGLASRTVSMAVEWARERGAALVLLWGADAGLYDRLGFELCGAQARVPLSALPPAAPPSFWGHGWTDGVMGALRARGSGLRLSDADARWLEAHRNVQWYWSGDFDAPHAYAAIGRGIDLQGFVHEWGGRDAPSLRSLLEVIRREHPRASLLGSPDILERWGIAAPRDGVEYLCRARALDVGKVFAAHGVPVAPGHPLLTPDAAVCRRLFGPGEDSRDSFPLWVWGLDAV